MTGAAVLPDLGGMAECFGIRVGFINDEGEMVALGHHDPHHTLAALNRASQPGLPDLLAGDHKHEPGRWKAALKAVRATWAVQVFRCDDSDCEGEETCRACREVRAAKWTIEFGDHLALRPDAFPIMYWPGM